MKKRIFMVLVIVSMSLKADAQSTFNLNSSNFLIYDIPFHNPAGISYLQRIQWSLGTQELYIKLSGDYLKNIFGSYVAPIGDHTAFGLRCVYFKSDLFRQGSYSILLGQKFFEDILSLGLNGNLLNYSYNSDRFQLVHPGDPLVAKGTSKTVFSTGMGILIHPSWWITFGGSVDHINRPDVSIDGSSVKKQPIYKFGLTLNTFPLQPQIDLKLQGDDILYQGGMRGYFVNQKVNLFFGYCFWGTTNQEFFSDRKNTVFEANLILKDLCFSYNYQYALTELNEVTDGSHRFGLIFSQGGFPRVHSAPVIDLSNPRETLVSAPTIKVAGRINNRDGITAVEVLRNGKLQKTFTYEEKPKSVDLAHEVLLDEGRNDLRIVAHGEKRRSSKKIQVTYIPLPEIDLLSPEVAVFDTNIYPLRAKIADNRGLVNVRISRNDEQIKEHSYPNRKKHAEVLLDVFLLEGLNAIHIAVENEYVENEKVIKVWHAKKNDPPKISLNSPAKGLTTDSTFVLDALINDDLGLDSTIVKLNDEILFGEEYPRNISLGGSLQVEKRIEIKRPEISELKLGENIFEIRTVDLGGRETIEKVDLTYWKNDLIIEAPQLVEQGEEYYYNVEYNDAIKTLKRAAAIFRRYPSSEYRDPKLLQAYILSGSAYLGLKNTEEAAKSFREALRMNPNLELTSPPHSPKIAEFFEKIAREKLDY